MKKSYILFLLSFILFYSLLFGLVYDRCSRPSVVTDTVQIIDTLYDTIRIEHTNIKYKTEKVLQRDTFINLQTDTVFFEEVQRTFNDTFTNDTDSVFLEMKLSGVNPRIDTLKADWRKGTIHQETIITEEKTKKKHFYWGPSVGVGYGVINRKPDVFVGVSVGYSF